MKRDSKLKARLAALGNSLPEPIGTPARPPRTEQGIGALRDRLGVRRRQTDPPAEPATITEYPVPGDSPVTGESPATPQSEVTGYFPATSPQTLEPQPQAGGSTVAVAGNTPVTGDAPVTGNIPAGSREIPVTADPPVTGIPPVTIEVEWKDGFLKIPNYVLFNLYPHLTVLERAVYQELYMWTHGFGRTKHLINQQTLCKSLRVDEKTLRKGIAGLESKGLVQRLGSNVRSRNEQRGTWVEVSMPRVKGGQGVTGNSPVAGKIPVTGNSPVTGKAPDHERKMKDTRETGSRTVYEIRTIAARLFEAHRGELGFDHDRLRQLVRDVLIGQGSPAESETIEEAIRGMAC